MGILTHSIPLPGRTGGVSGPKNYHTDISYILYVPFNNRPSKTSTFIGVSGPNCHTDVLYLLYAPLNNIPSKTSTFIGLSGPKKLSYRPIIYLICLFQQRPCSTFISLPKEMHSSYFRKKSFNNSYHSSYFRKQYIHLTSKRSLSTILTSSYNFYFILFPKEVYSSYFRKKSFNNSYHLS